MLTNRALLPVVLLVALSSAGCATEKIFYSVNIGTSEPTEAGDAPGIWFDKERHTPERPRPIPVRDVLVNFDLVKTDGTRQPIEAGRTTHDGWTFFRGKLEVEKDAHFALRTKKAGYTNFERLITVEQAKDATMTFVLKPTDPAAKAAEDAARAKSEESHPRVDSPPAARDD